MKMLVTLLLSLMMQAGGQPINIPVTASGWKFSKGAGPNGTNGCAAGYVATCTQDLGRSPASLQVYDGYHVHRGFYAITFTTVSSLGVYPDYYVVKLGYGTQELCSPDGWATDIITTVTFICPSPGYLILDRQLPDQQPAQGANNLVLSFSVNYWQGVSDNFSVTFTPNN